MSTPVAPNATDAALDALRASHERELQRVALEGADRLRRSESERLKLQEKLEDQAEAAADRLDALMARTQVAAQEAAARQADAAQREASLLASVARLEERLSGIQAQLTFVRDERDSQLREREVLKRERDALARERETLLGDCSALTSERDELAQVRETLSGQLQVSEAARQVEHRLLSERIAAVEADSLAREARATAARRQSEERIEAIERERLQAMQQMQRERDASAQAAREKQTSLERERTALQASLNRVEQALESAQAEASAFERRREAQAEALRKAIRDHEALEAEQKARLAQATQELTGLRKAHDAAHRQVHALQQSRSFRLGQALAAARRWRGLMALPGRLVELARDADAAGMSDGPNRLEAPAQAMLERAFAKGGLTGATRELESLRLTPVQQAQAYTQLARQALATDVDSVCTLARRAFELDPRPFRRKWYGFLLADAGAIRAAHDLLSGLPADVELKASERNKRERVEGQYRLLTVGLVLPERAAATSSDPNASRAGPLMYVAASALPYHVSGYTQRTHALLVALQALGHDVVCTTRPGYPDDREDARAKRIQDETVIDGVRYLCLPGPSRARLAPDAYVEQSAALLAKAASSIGASAIHAASNHENALPALVAARRLGLPFVYEVRGLWEYTSASKRPGWEASDAFKLGVQLETLVARSADRVYTLNEAMRAELAHRGVAPDRLALAPNGVDPDRFVPQAADPALLARLGWPARAFVVGYAGSLLAYEGLDDLIAAASLLRDQMPALHLLIVGGGDALPALRSQAEASGLGARVHFTGPLAPAEVAAHLATMQVVALPRKPVTVCRLVSPLKPLEAMSMARALVVSDVEALAEMVRDGETGLVVRAGDATSLAHALERLASDPALAARLGSAARDEVLQHRRWVDVAKVLETGHPGLAITTLQDDGPLLLPDHVNSLDEDQKREFDRRLRDAFAAGGVGRVRALLARQSEGRSARFAAFCAAKAAGVCLDAGDATGAIALAEQALAQDNGAGTLRAVARLFSNAAAFEQAADTADALDAALPEASAADRRFIDELRGRRQFEQFAMQRSSCAFEPVPERVLNLLAFSLPYTSVGYATRSHGLALGIRNAGWDLRPYTRPGFPQDFKPELQSVVLPPNDVIDGITYGRIFAAERTVLSEVEYMQASVSHYERLIHELRPCVVHAASNYVTALPALVAARRAGVPFVYEVRGFWEVTRSSRDAEFERTAKFRHMERFERLVASAADRVITITSAMREELIARGVEPDRIDIAFNSVDPSRFTPSERDEGLAADLGLPPGVPVIGYVGSFVDYEGLDDLVTAVAGLRDEGADFRLLLVGDGAVFDDLKAQVQALSLESHVILTGRVPHDHVENYYSLIDITPFPRKPWEVCELVSPLKPFEAMALRKAVVVSGTRALVEIVQDETNGLVFTKGDTRSLQSALGRLLAEPALRRRLGHQARAWIEQERSWNRSGEVVVSSYRLALAQAQAGAADQQALA